MSDAVLSRRKPLTERIDVYVTPEQKARVFAVAARRGMSAAQFVRTVVETAAPQIPGRAV